MRKVPIAIAFYLSSGVLQPAIIDFLRYANVISNPLYLQSALANVAAMALSSLLVYKQWPSWQKVLKVKKPVLFAGVLDLLSCSLASIGLMYTGGGVFIVCLSSITAWTAFFSYWFLNEQFSTQKILGVSLVCLGIAFNAFSHFGDEDVDQSFLKDDNDTKENAKVLLGSFLIVVSSLFHAAVFVIGDYVIVRKKLLKPLVWSGLLGMFQLCSILFLWLPAVYLFSATTLSDKDINNDGNNNNYDSNDSSYNSSSIEMAIGIFALIVVDFIHVVTFFVIFESLGGISTSLVKGTQIIFVFFFSAFFFCENQASQCLTNTKIISIVIITIGTYIYSHATSRQPTYESKQLNPI